MIVDLIVIIATVDMGPTTNGKELIGHRLESRGVYSYCTANYLAIHVSTIQSVAIYPILSSSQPIKAFCFASPIAVFYLGF